MPRKTNNFLQSWLEFSSAWEAPERFRLWSGISAVSAVLQRRVWTFVRGQVLYPNTYILLVGSPGSGKGNAMKFLAKWLKAMPEDKFKIAPDGLTQRSFYQVLEAAGTLPGELETEQHALTAFIEELGVFLRAGDNAFIYSICHIYDCPDKFHYKTAHSGENYAVNTAFTMLSACTPKGVKDLLTEDVMELGITARTIIIYAEKLDENAIDIFGKRRSHDKLEKDLRYDLDRIRDSVHGEYQFDTPAAEGLVAWSKTSFAPIPRDPRFEHYNSRRFVQIVKLCMIVAAAKRDDPVILLEDFEQARSMLLEAETVMPQAIRTVGQNPVLAQQQLALALISTTWDKFQKPTEEHEIYRALGRDINPFHMKNLLEYISSAKWVEVVGKEPNRGFYPRGKAPKIARKKDE